MQRRCSSDRRKQTIPGPKRSHDAKRRLVSQRDNQCVCAPCSVTRRQTHSALVQAIDSGNVSTCMLVLLDLSAAFDTVDHNILLSIHNTRFSVHGTALDWFRSYLSGRTQSFIYNDDYPVDCSVPQGQCWDRWSSLHTLKIPKLDSRRCRRMSWSTVSNAADRSRRTRAAKSPRSTARRMSDKTHRTADSVE